MSASAFAFSFAFAAAPAFSAASASAFAFASASAFAAAAAAASALAFAAAAAAAATVSASACIAFAESSTFMTGGVSVVFGVSVFVAAAASATLVFILICAATAAPTNLNAVPFSRTLPPSGMLLLAAPCDCFLLGWWCSSRFVLSNRCLQRRIFCSIMPSCDSVATAKAASNSISAKSSSSLASSAVAFLKYALSQSGRSSTHFSASAKACDTLDSFRNDALRLL